MYPLNILLIEDQAITAEDVKQTLEKAGHRLIAKAVNRQEALAAVEIEVPDVAIVDIHLAGSTVDGIAIVQELLALTWIPIIYLTANSEIPTFQRAKKTRPAAYLLKPFQQKELAFQVELAYLNQYEKRPKFSLDESESLYIPIKKNFVKIEKRDILYIKAVGSYVDVFMINQEQPHLLTMHLGHIIQYFSPTQFFRLSRSLLINLSRISRIEGSHLYFLDYPKPLLIPEAIRSELLKRLMVVRTPPKPKADRL